MKKVVIFILAIFIIISVSGCTPGWYEHDSIYKTNDHMFFSLWGYKNPDTQDLKNSSEQKWWGEEVQYVPSD